MCGFVVLGLILTYQAKRLAWGTSLKWPILCWEGVKTLINQSVEQLVSFSGDRWCARLYLL